MLLLCPFLKPKSSNGSPKNVHANFVRHIKNIGFIWLYPIDLQNFAIILLLEFILSLKSYEIKLI